MNLKIFLIILGFINPEEQQSFDHYVTGINSLYENVGAKVVDRYPIAQMVLGEEKPDFIMIVEFPNQEAFMKLFSSEDYKKLLPYRKKGFKKLNVFISKK
jgi:uncharacterized protein (DUF1330 family)